MYINENIKWQGTTYKIVIKTNSVDTLDLDIILNNVLQEKHHDINMVQVLTILSFIGYIPDSMVKHFGSKIKPFVQLVSDENVIETHYKIIPKVLSKNYAFLNSVYCPTTDKHRSAPDLPEDLLKKLLPSISFKDWYYLSNNEKRLFLLFDGEPKSDIVNPVKVKKDSTIDYFKIPLLYQWITISTRKLKPKDLVVRVEDMYFTVVAYADASHFIDNSDKRFINYGKTNPIFYKVEAISDVEPELNCFPN